MPYTTATTSLAKKAANTTMAAIEGVVNKE
jgi:hypothetical protein